MEAALFACLSLDSRLKRKINKIEFADQALDAIQ